MLCLAMTLWLMMIVLSAWGVYRLLSGMVRPRIINMLLLPGTLVAQLGHVVGLLVTGATVNDTTLYKDDESGGPGATQNAQPRIPVLGHMIIGSLPLLACVLALVPATHYLGQGILGAMGNQEVATVLPTSSAAMWNLLHNQIGIAESLVNATAGAMPGSWELWLFLYLIICLTVRMAPLPGNLRGSLGAIALLGLLSALVSLMTDAMPRYIHAGWQTLTLTVAVLTILLMVTAVIRGSVGLVKLLVSNS